MQAKILQHMSEVNELHAILIILGFSFSVCNRLWHKPVLSCVLLKLFLGLFKGESYKFL